MSTATRTGTYSDGSHVEIIGERGGFTYITFIDGRNKGVSTKVPPSWVVEVESSDPEAAAPTHHIISNAEISLTECGRMLEYHDAGDPTPWPLSDRSAVAIWDNDEPDRSSACCHACMTAYSA